MMELSKERRKTNRAIIITAIILLISAICLTINYSIDQSINWSLYPIGALIVIWMTIIPWLIMKKYKALGLITGLAISLIPYLFLIENQVSIQGWVIPLALPIALLFLCAFGVSLMAFTNPKLNKFYAAAIAVFLFGVIVNYGVGRIVNNFLNENNINDIYKVSTMSVSAILSFIFIISGYIKRNKTNPQQLYNSF